MKLSTESIGAIRRLLSHFSRGQIKQLLLDAGASKERILPIPVINNMKSHEYKSKAELLTLMFDTIYSDFENHEADNILLNLVKIISKGNIGSWRVMGSGL